MLDIRVSFKAKVKTQIKKSNDNLDKSQRIKELRLCPKDGQMSNQCFQLRPTIQLGF